jgi:hypothetical protein
MDIVVPELANAVYEDRVRDATKARSVSTPRRTKGLPSLLRSLLHLFA